MLKRILFQISFYFNLPAQDNRYIKALGVKEFPDTIPVHVGMSDMYISAHQISRQGQSWHNKDVATFCFIRINKLLPDSSSRRA
jgi:hypothetical protein